VLVVIVACPRAATACSCVEYLTDPVEALGKSSLVFAGEVVSVDVVTIPEISYSEDKSGAMVPSSSMQRKGVVTLRTLKEWKGDGSKEYTVLAGAPPVTPLPKGWVMVDCEEHLEVGQQYLIFVDRYGYAEVNPCAPTSELQKAKDQVAALDRHATAKQATPTPSRSKGRHAK